MSKEDAKAAWEKMIRNEAQERADRDNEASSHCGAWGDGTAEEYIDDVREEFEGIGRAFVALSED